MAIFSPRRWKSFEEKRSTAFTIAGLIFLIDAIVVSAIVVTGDESLNVLGQVFVGAAWTAAFVGLFGLYPSLADRSRWISRIGLVCAVIGSVVFAVMAVASALYFANVPDGTIQDVVPIFLPGVVLGSVLGFLLFSAAILRTDVYTQTFGVLLILPAVIVVMNILLGAAYNSPTVTLVIVIGQALAHLGIGYQLRTGAASSGQPAAASRAAR